MCHDSDASWCVYLSDHKNHPVMLRHIESCFWYLSTTRNDKCFRCKVYPRKLVGVQLIQIHSGYQLRDNLARVASETDAGSPIDVLPWVSRMTLDIIGLAGESIYYGSLTHVDSFIQGSVTILALQMRKHHRMN